MEDRKKIFTIEEDALAYFHKHISYLDYNIARLTAIFNGSADDGFTKEDCMNVYTFVYGLCSRSHAIQDELYRRYEYVLEHWVNSLVIPSLRGKQNEDLVQELVDKWIKYKNNAKILSCFFGCLEFKDLHFHSHNHLPRFRTASFFFQKLVNPPFLEGALKPSIINLIRQAREEEQVDLELLKNLLDLIKEMGLAKEFEQIILEDIHSYYTKKASNWLVEYSRRDYFLKIDECLKREIELAACYPSSGSESIVKDSTVRLYILMSCLDAGSRCLSISS